MNIISFTVDAVAQVKYTDYDIDLRNNKITFSALTGGEAIVTTYDYNTNGYSWIHPANPERDNTGGLVRTDYPRIAVTAEDTNHNFIGMGSDSQFSSVLINIEIATKDRLKCSNYVRVKSDGTTETITEDTLNVGLVEVLAMQLINAVKRNWRADMGQIFFLPENAFKNNGPARVKNDTGVISKIIQIEINGLDLDEDN